MYERKNYIVAIISLIVSIGALLLAYRSIATSEKIAELSGSFEKAEIIVGLGGNPLQIGRTNHIIIGATTISSPTILSIGSIPFSFKSNGKKSLKSLLISFQYHPLFKRKIFEDQDMHISGAFLTNDIEKSSSEKADRYFVNYMQPTLNPGISINIQEPIILSATSIYKEMPVTTKGNVQMTMPVTVKYAVNFAFAVSALDTQVQAYPISLSIQEASSFQQLVSGPLQEHIQHRQKEIRGKIGMASYFSALITSSPQEVAFLIFSKQEKFPDANYIFYNKTNSIKNSSVTYPLLSWSLLFQNEK